MHRIGKIGWKWRDCKDESDAGFLKKKLTHNLMHDDAVGKNLNNINDSRT
jgi:hypothetical protein